jgi:hypothetical protein
MPGSRCSLGGYVQHSFRSLRFRSLIVLLSSPQYHCDLCGKNYCFKELNPQKMSIPYLSPSPGEGTLSSPTTI